MFVDAIGAGMAAAACPTAFINQVMQPLSDYSRDIMSKGNVPYVIPGLRQAVVALRNVAWWSEATGSPSAPATTSTIPTPPENSRHGRWSEDAARRMLAEAGVPVVPAVLVTSADEAVKAALDIGQPLALKIVSPDILHKSDIGGVRLEVAPDEQAVRAAYAAVTAAAATVPDARLDGVLVSPMRRGGVELLVGVVRDPQWGPMLAVAFGGIYVEILHDSALAPLPVTPNRARSMLERLRGIALLQGARGGTPANLDAVAATVASVADLAVALGDDLESLEINPLRVDGDSVEALDAVVTWMRKDQN
jgi:acyl-CoA synthetase (NDP forming)